MTTEDYVLAQQLAPIPENVGFQTHRLRDAFKILAGNSKNGLCNFLYFLLYYVSVEIQTHFYNTIDVV